MVPRRGWTAAGRCYGKNGATTGSSCTSIYLFLWGLHQRRSKPARSIVEDLSPFKPIDGVAIPLVRRPSSSGTDGAVTTPAVKTEEHLTPPWLAESCPFSKVREEAWPPGQQLNR